MSTRVRARPATSNLDRSLRPRIPWWSGAALPAVVLTIAALTVVVGLWLQADAPGGLTTEAPGRLGTPLPPFLMNWKPRLRSSAWIAIVVCLGCAWLAPRVVASVRSRAGFAVSSYAGALAVGLSLNAARLGTAGFSQVFRQGPGGSSEASREYLPSLSMLDHGIHYYVGHFASLLPYLTTHVKGNPPGPLIALHLLGVNTPGRLTALCIGLGALTAPLAYALGRSLGGERRGRIAAALTVFSPSLLLFGVTSVDYVFAALATAIAWLLVTPTARTRAAGCALAAIGSFCSWLLLAIPVWAALVVWRRRGIRSAAVTAAAAAAAVLALNLILVVALGYDPVAVLHRLGHIYATGIATRRPYAFWLLGSPVAWLLMLGPPIAWIACRALGRGDPAALALAAVIVVASVAGFTKAETERIWLPFVPLACVAAAARPIPRLRLVLVTLTLQALAVELLFNTVW